MNGETPHIAPPILEFLEQRLLLSVVYPDLQNVLQPYSNPALPAGFDTFAPPVSSATPAANTPTFAEWTRQAQPGNTLVLTGAQFTEYTGIDAGKDTTFVLYGQTAAGNGITTQGIIQQLTGNTAAIALDGALPSGGMYLLWAQNANGASYPVAINQTQAWWIGPESATDGSTVSIYGHNLSYLGGTSQSWVYIEPVAPTVNFGNALAHRANVDSSAGAGMYYQLAQPLPQGQTVTSWGFFNDSATTGQKITPVIFQQTSPGNLKIVGVGTTQTNAGTGEQDFSFGLTSGSALVSGANYYFGWRYGGTAASSTSAGCAEYDSWVPNSMNAYALYSSGGVAAVAGNTFSGSTMDGYTQSYRTFSVRCVTSSVPTAAAPFWATVTAVNPYKVDFTVPSNLPDGNYNVWINNGSCGAYGWSGPLTLTVVDPVTWYGGVYNVKSYGATGDGVTDDTAAIQACLSAARNHVQVYFPAGTYMVSANLRVGGGWAAPQLWYGDVDAGGKPTSILKLTATASLAYPYLVFGVNSQSQIKNMTVDVSQSATPSNCQSWTSTGKDAMYDRFGYDQQFTNVTFFGGLNAGVDVNGGHGLAFTNCNFTGTDNFLGAARQVFISGCSFYATNDANTLCDTWGGGQVAMFNCTAQDYDNSTTANGNGWGQGRWFYGLVNWGSDTNDYLGNNTSNDMAVRPGFWNQNTGEQFLWEGGQTNYTGMVASATSTTATIASLIGAAVNLGEQAFVVGGDGLGQVRTITAFNSATGAITLDRPWNLIPDATSQITVCVSTFNVAVYGNHLSGKSAYYLTNNTASTGVEPFNGGANIIVDDNTFTYMHWGGMSIWGCTGSNGVTQPLYFNLYQNNTINNCYAGACVNLGAWTTPSDGAVNLLANVFRGNTLTHIAGIGFAIGGGANGNEVRAIDLLILDCNTESGAPIAVDFTGTPAAGSSYSTLLCNNLFSLGGGAYSGSEGLYSPSAAENLELRNNTWTGFQTAYAGVLPGAVLQEPYRVFDLTAAPGGSAQATLNLWNAGTSSLSYTLTDTAAWLTLAPTSGSVANQSSTANITMTCSAAGLAPGTYTATVTATAGSQTMKDTVVFNVVSPPDITAVSLNNVAGRSVSAIDPSGIGVEFIVITFSKPVNFTAGAVAIQDVTVPNGIEVLGASLTPSSVTGSGTHTMTLALPMASVVDTWVKVILTATGITDSDGYALDGDPKPGGSGRGYIYSSTLDLPTGDGTPGGNAVFYVGNLRGDFKGVGFGNNSPDGKITQADIDGFTAAYQAGNLSADFKGVGFGNNLPDGQITQADIDGFTAVYQAALANGTHLDALPTTLQQHAMASQPSAQTILSEQAATSTESFALNTASPFAEETPLTSASSNAMTPNLESASPTTAQPPFTATPLSRPVLSPLAEQTFQPAQAFRPTIPASLSPAADFETQESPVAFPFGNPQSEIVNLRSSRAPASSRDGTSPWQAIVPSASLRAVSLSNRNRLSSIDNPPSVLLPVEPASLQTDLADPFASVEPTLTIPVEAL